MVSAAQKVAPLHSPVELIRNGKPNLDGQDTRVAQPRETVSAAFDSWWGSRSSLMVLVSILLVFGATTIMYFAEHYKSLALEILRPVADAMLVVSVTVLLTELGPFRTYVEERLQALKKVLDRPIFDRLTDASYLRDNFKPHLVLALQRASTCASLPANIRDYPEFLSVIDRFVIPLAAETIWRKDFNLSVTHKIYERAGQTLLQQKSTLSWTYVNTGNDERDLDIPLGHEGMKLPGIPNEDLCCNGWAKVRTEGLTNETLIRLTFEQVALGDSVRFEAKVPVRVGARTVFVSTGYDAVRAPNDATRLSFSVPTTGLSVTYQHPPEIKTELYCFNVGGELNEIVKEQTLHQWKHTGTFLPRHGAVLTHSLMRRRAEKITVEKSKLAS